MSTTDEQRLREALTACRRELLDVLESVKNGNVHHDGDDFHESLRLADNVLAQQAPTPAVLLPAAPATRTGIDYSPDQQAAARLAMMTAASMLETLPWSSELDGRKRRETAQEHQDRISMVIEKHELRRALIDELRALAEPVAEVSEPAAPVALPMNDLILAFELEVLAVERGSEAAREFYRHAKDALYAAIAQQAPTPAVPPEPARCDWTPYGMVPANGGAWVQHHAAISEPAVPVDARLLDIAQRLSIATDECGDKAEGTHYIDKHGVIRCKGSFLALIADARAATAAAPAEGAK